MALRVVAILGPVTRPMPPEVDAGWTAPEGSWATSEATRRTMLHNRGRDTKPGNDQAESGERRNTHEELRWVVEGQVPTMTSARRSPD